MRWLLYSNGLQYTVLVFLSLSGSLKEPRTHIHKITQTDTLMYVERFCLACWTSSWQFSPYSMQMVGVTPR